MIAARAISKEHWAGGTRSSIPMTTRDRTAASEKSAPNGDELELRDVMVHMVEEYARHNGPADFLRERYPGRHIQVQL
jgi:hypothetical protein